MSLAEDHFGRRFLCPRRPLCGGSHGAHPDGSPLGVPADENTRRARSFAHSVFDRLWSEGHMTRSEAYRWMQGAMGLLPEESHIGAMNAVTCRELARRVVAAFPDVFPFSDRN